MRHFYSAILHTIHHTKRRHEFTRCVGRNHKLAAAQFANLFHKGFGGTVDGVKRLRKAGSQAPTNSGLGMHSGCSARGQHAQNTYVFESKTTFHF